MMGAGKPQNVLLCKECGLSVASHAERGVCPALWKDPVAHGIPGPHEGLGAYLQGMQRIGETVRARVAAARPGDPRFHAILKETADLHDKKQADYGLEQDPLANLRASTEWGMPAWVGAMLRLTDKVRRLQAFARKGILANESAVDSLNDIAVYAILARILLEEEQAAPAATKGEDA